MILRDSSTAIALLVGNDINNINNAVSWKDLIGGIIKFCKVQKSIKDLESKPFPLLYEEIFLKSIQANHQREINLKRFIAEQVALMESNSIHERISSLNIKNILTTNYEFLLENEAPVKNTGQINEKLYSIFRHYQVNGKNYWHIHGDCNYPASINLGFEHYGGQLQQIRNYVVSGTHYNSAKIEKEPLIRRLKKNQESLSLQSWIELFFTSDIYIFGLSLDFIETDLWWILTYRARYKFYSKKEITNNITYFYPDKYKKISRPKLDLFQSVGVKTLPFSSKNKLGYYNRIIDYIESEIKH